MRLRAYPARQWVRWVMSSALLLACTAAGGADGPVPPGQPSVPHPTAAPACAPVVFEAAFFPGAVVRQDTLTVRLRTEFLGNLPLPSGRVVARDPVAGPRPAFEQVLPRGSFPVELALARRGADERVAFARLVLSGAAVARWEMARLPGQAPLPVDGPDLYGYSVDAGVGMLLDAEASQALEERLTERQATWNDIFVRGFEPVGGAPRPGLLYQVKGQALAAFSTGFGDGFYATYIGYDRAGQPCRLLTDFQVINWQKP